MQEPLNSCEPHDALCFPTFAERLDQRGRGLTRLAVVQDEHAAHHLPTAATACRIALCGNAQRSSVCRTAHAPGQQLCSSKAPRALPGRRCPLLQQPSAYPLAPGML
jgi:hypothetical protein